MILTNAQLAKKLIQLTQQRDILPLLYEEETVLKEAAKRLKDCNGVTKLTSDEDSIIWLLPSGFAKQSIAVHETSFELDVKYL